MEEPSWVECPKCGAVKFSTFFTLLSSSLFLSSIPLSLSFLSLSFFYPIISLLFSSSFFLFSIVFSLSLLSLQNFLSFLLSFLFMTEFLIIYLFLSLSLSLSQTHTPCFSLNHSIPRPLDFRTVLNIVQRSECANTVDLNSFYQF